MTRRNRKFSALMCCVLMTALASAVYAQQPACKPALAAMKKYVTTPNHSFVTQSGDIADGKAQSSESIYAAATRYIQLQGQWIVNPMDTADLLKAVDDNAATAQCRFVRDEVVAGEPAEVYDVQNQSEYSKSDNQIWVSKRSGLLLKEESALIAAGAGHAASHIALRVEYANVQAPVGAKTISGK